MNNTEYQRLAALYLDTIYRVALNGCKNHTDAEDVVQNTFLKLLKKENAFADDDHARKWLIRFAINECNTLWRSPWKKQTSSLEELSTEPAFSSPEKSELYHAVMELPAKYRQIVHLYYFEGYSVREIAEIICISETAVQTRLLRASTMPIFLVAITKRNCRNSLLGYSDSSSFVPIPQTSLHTSLCKYA